MGVMRPDSEFMLAVGKVVDYVMLNLLCVVFSIPVITAAAAMTARFYVSMKLCRGEEPQVFTAFLKSFRENFKQATLIWIPVLFIGSLICWDWYQILFGKSQSMFLAGRIVFLIMTVFLWAVVYNIFPFLARFHVSTKELIKAAGVFSFLNFPKMLLILAVTVVPYIVEMWYLEWGLAIWLLCTTATLYYVSQMYVKAFGKLEEGGI